MVKRTKGKCKYCGKEYTFRYMDKHLSDCKERQKVLSGETGGRQCGYFELAIYPVYKKDYWLFIEMKETATLKDLDIFLRDIWVECCGHLSEFEIDNVIYDVSPEIGDFYSKTTKSMNYKLKSVLEKGMIFRYEYDFGSTTELFIKVADYRTGKFRKEKLIILSRNNPIAFLCEECEEKPAVAILSERYFMNGTGFVCKDCAKEYEENDEMLLEICNSPRMGVCGYGGSDIYPDQFVPDKQEA